jgi:tRNA pseudouridine32 synthase/23S rRNA pseudouridine746 synthase
MIRASQPSLVKLSHHHDFSFVIDFLCANFPDQTREVWLERMANQLVLDGDKQALGATSPYRRGSRIYYFKEVENEPVIPFEENIVHCDENLVVVDKPHFLPVTPSGPYVTQCLVDRLRRRFNNPQLSPANRLDKDTAGLVLFTTSPQGRALVQNLFRDRAVEKEYEARVSGSQAPTWREANLATCIERDGNHWRMKHGDGAPNSWTRIEVRSWNLATSTGVFALWPSTGKKHQLRLHCAQLGFPIINDRFYPELEPAVARDDFSQPLQLLAKRLAFVDPFRRRQVEFVSTRKLHTDGC